MISANSDGAKVWSPSQQILLKYDPIESNKLFFALQHTTLTTAYPSFKLDGLNPSHFEKNAVPQQRGARSRIDTRFGEMNDFYIEENKIPGSEWGPRRKRLRQEECLSPAWSNDWSMEKTTAPVRQRCINENRRWSSWGDPPSWNEYRKDDKILPPPHLPIPDHIPPSWSSKNNSFETINRPWNMGRDRSSFGASWEGTKHGRPVNRDNSQFPSYFPEAVTMCDNNQLIYPHGTSISANIHKSNASPLT